MVQVPVIVKVSMMPYQSVLYRWVKATGTLRMDPEGPRIGSILRAYASLNNKCMELRKVRGLPRTLQAAGNLHSLPVLASPSCAACPTTMLKNRGCLLLESRVPAYSPSLICDGRGT